MQNQAQPQRCKQEEGEPGRRGLISLSRKGLVESVGERAVEGKPGRQTRHAGQRQQRQGEKQFSAAGTSGAGPSGGS